MTWQYLTAVVSKKFKVLSQKVCKRREIFWKFGLGVRNLGDTRYLNFPFQNLGKNENSMKNNSFLCLRGEISVKTQKLLNKISQNNLLDISNRLIRVEMSELKYLQKKKSAFVLKKVVC